MAADRVKEQVAANWSNALLVCGKCSKRVGGGFGGGFGDKGKSRLAKALRRYLAVGKGRKARIGVVEVKCLGVCPKHAVTLVDTARPHEWLLVRPGTDMAAIVARLSGAGAMEHAQVDRAA